MENIQKNWEFNVSSIFLNHTFVKVKEIDKKSMRRVIDVFCAYQYKLHNFHTIYSKLCARDTH